MSRSTFALVSLLALLTVLLGYNYFAKPFGNTSTNTKITASPSPTPSNDSNQAHDFASLTPEQRVALVMAVPVTVSDDTSIAWARDHHPGVTILFGTKIATDAAQQVVAQLKAISPTPLIAVDHEGGKVQRLNGVGFTALPSWQKLCLMSESDRQTTLLQSATELQKVGVNIVFGPVVDLATSSSALGSRACAGSPELVASRSQEYLKMFTAKGILPVIKHFPGIGSVTIDLHTGPATIEPTPQELSVYQYILTNYPEVGVMMAHVSIKGGLKGEVCSLSADCVQGFKNLFAKTIVFTDALDMKAAGVDPSAKASASAQLRPLSDRAVRAVNAGDDVLVFGPDVSASQLDEVYATLVQQYKQDQDTRVAIDHSAEKIFTLMQKDTSK